MLTEILNRTSNVMTDNRPSDADQDGDFSDVSNKGPVQNQHTVPHWRAFHNVAVADDDSGTQRLTLRSKYMWRAAGATFLPAGKRPGYSRYR
jgi:hypothetical protein